MYGIWISAPRSMRIQLGRSSTTQSHTYSTPAAARMSGVSTVSRRPGLSQPRGRAPVKARSLSRHCAISSASPPPWLSDCWCMPWPMNSQPARSMASAARG
ncbi:Uncharacterised protein [Bordetella pertussis]|nr:Uncharacterised protein [Bordetella pertussis]